MTRPNKFKTSKPSTRHTTTKLPKASKILPTKPLISDDTQADTQPRGIKRKRNAKQETDDEQAPQLAPAEAPSAIKTATVPAQPAANLVSVPLPTTTTTTPSTSLFPPEIETLRAKYTLHTHPITSSSKMHTKVTSVLSQLSSELPVPTAPTDPPKEAERPTIIALSARSKAATKLVSVIEVVKRELDGRGWSWWQYNGVHGVLDEMSDKHEGGTDNAGLRGKKRAGESKGEDGGEEDGEEEAFERMVVPGEEERQKVRQTPVITIYLSRTPVLELRGRFGEQFSVVESS
ncbi:hypothetical protein H2199_004872 [Coniosporium tulheliwenetii]|uniref:Uncharacterized protein n=1 Tax=Coniosporium tulheliwenetii TaxID=3383036 RepID=A0ACC2Z4A2_9PEZI|nr:hypothetical protein H2199_004872 [Cladosporium sp. JES 115]